MGRRLRNTNIVQPSDINLRTCTRCGSTKPIDAFSPAKPHTPNFKTYGGFHMPCKACQASRAAEYRERAEVKLRLVECRRVKNANITDEERARRSANSRLRYASDPRFRADTLRRCAARNDDPSRRAARKATWKRYVLSISGRNSLSAAYHNRRARMRGSVVVGHVPDWVAIKDSFKHRCAYCGCEPNRLTLDHVIPISRGGMHVKDNIVPACLQCNQRKNKSSLDDFINRRGLDRTRIALRIYEARRQLET